MVMSIRSFKQQKKLSILSVNIVYHSTFYKSKNRLFSQIKSEEYWSFLANEMDYFFRKWERIANDLWKFIQLVIFTFLYLHNAFMVICSIAYMPVIANLPVYIMTLYLYKILLHEYMIILSELTGKWNASVSTEHVLKSRLATLKRSILGWNPFQV